MLFGQLWSQEEYSLLTQLAPLPGQAHLPATYAGLLTPLTTLFNITLSSLSALIKRSLHKYTFHALASYSALSTCQDRWDDLITRKAERKENELKEGLHALRGVCLRSFPEFLADLKLAGMGKGGEIGTGCADFTITVRPPHGLISTSLIFSHLDYALSGTIARGSRCCRTRPDDTRRWELEDGRRRSGETE